jgi:hypothetical protein
MSSVFEINDHFVPGIGLRPLTFCGQADISTQPLHGDDQ